MAPLEIHLADCKFLFIRITSHKPIYTFSEHE